jgi:hypothetical protein
MNTAVTLFEQPQMAPAYLATSAVAKALQEQMEGGLAGRSINRISLRNGKFRFIKGGVEVMVSPKPTLDVVVVAANPAVSRTFYLKAYDSDAAGERPDCYSKGGVVPEDDSPAKQSPQCATCPKNAVGSALNGKGKACSYKKRIVVMAGSLTGEPWAIDIAAMGLFGDDAPANRLFNLKSYIEALKVNGLIVPAVITRLSFDDNESVPKLFFTPVRVLSAEEFATVEAMLVNPDVVGMLDEIDNKGEAGKTLGPAIAAPAAQAAPAQAAAPVVQTPAPAAPAQAPAAAPAARRGRPAKAETAPAAAPAPTAAPAQVVEGFGEAAAPAQAAAPAAQAAAPAAAAPGGFTVDLNDFDV